MDKGNKGRRKERKRERDEKHLSDIVCWTLACCSQQISPWGSTHSLLSQTENQICTNCRRCSTCESFGNRVMKTMTMCVTTWGRVVRGWDDLLLQVWYDFCRSSQLQWDLIFFGSRTLRCVFIATMVQWWDTDRFLRLSSLRMADWSFWLVLKRLSDSSDTLNSEEWVTTWKLDHTVLSLTYISRAFKAFCALTS